MPIIMILNLASISSDVFTTYESTQYVVIILLLNLSIDTFATFIFFMKNSSECRYTFFFWQLLVNKDEKKYDPYNFWKTWYHSCLNISSGLGEEEIQTNIVTDNASPL